MTHESALQWTLAVVNRSEPSAPYADMDDAALVLLDAHEAQDALIEHRVNGDRHWSGDDRARP